jgi:hypothetical protein
MKRRQSAERDCVLPGYGNLAITVGEQALSEQARINAEIRAAQPTLYLDLSERSSAEDEFVLIILEQGPSLGREHIGCSRRP